MKPTPTVSTSSMGIWIDSQIENRPVRAMAGTPAEWERDGFWLVSFCFDCNRDLTQDEIVYVSLDETVHGRDDPKCDHDDDVELPRCRACARKRQLRNRDVPRALFVEEMAMTYGWIKADDRITR